MGGGDFLEEWKDIPGYEGLYEASNLGRIRTAEGKTTSNSRYGKRVWKQRVLKLNYNRRCNSQKKDAMIDLWKDGKRKHLNVARVVAMTWCEGFCEGMTVNHKDGDPGNNRADNLEWLSLKDNVIHAFANGLCTNQKPCVLVDRNGNSKKYQSLAEASRSIGRSDKYISGCIALNRVIRSSGGEVYGLI